jgi:hypothetical protein
MSVRQVWQALVALGFSNSEAFVLALKYAG